MSNADESRDTALPQTSGDASESDTESQRPPETTPHCPFCGSRETEVLSPFASQLSTSQYVCLACHSPFELFTRGA